MVQLYGDYCKQILPFAGGSMDQPNYYTEAMRIIDGHLNGDE